jgi:hypothetical protein
MNIAELLYKRQHDAQIPKFAEYPKWVKADGKNVLVNSAEEEASLLGASEPEPDTPRQVSNLLSEPPIKRRGCPPGGWPKKSPSES